MPDASAAAVDPAQQMRPLEDRVFRLVQEERQAIDPAASPLVLDPILMDVARKRSADMAAKGYFEDRAPDGTTSASMVMDEDSKFQGLLGVNMAAQHYNKQSGIDVEAFAHRFIETWLASQSHKQNLAFPDYNRTGVGCALNGDTVYVTQLFATDLGLPPPKEDTRKDTVKAMPSPQAAKSAMQSKKPALRTPPDWPDDF
ncbi:MAG TPA: CAP domain-containing protein [Rhizomicrobium sp.]|nr:CAP domain-containing protein [Rhizomicrobium sp.]